MNSLSTTMNTMPDSTSLPHPDRSMHALVSRHRGWIKLGSILGIIIGVFLIMRTLPVAAGMDRLQVWVDDLGAWGPLTFGAVYAIAAVLFVPGSIMTLAGGAIFGVVWGTVTISLASTTAAAISFLIGRYAARDTVRQQAAKYPKFGAVDRAIGQDGWKIVALLRLAPIFPFSVGNYLLGLTSVRFWPYVLASWLAMLPGTVLYVYLGHVGRASVEAAAGPGGGRSAAEWAMLILGLLAILGLVIYIVRFALKAISEHTDVEPDASHAPREEAPNDASGKAESGFWPVVSLLGTAVIVLVLGACATLKPDWLSGMFGPPSVVPQEEYSEQSGAATFDHSVFDSLVRTYVAEGGWVDYAALHARGRDKLNTYLQQIAEVDFDTLGRDEKLAMLINAYNAFTLELILEYWNDGALKSIKDIPVSQRWSDVRWKVGENTWSLNQIEHEQVRPKFREPRIHWALVCTAVGCPPLRAEAYTGARIEVQLAEQAQTIHSDDRWFSYDREAGVVHATELYRWYGGDFEIVDGGVLQHAATYVPQLHEDLETGVTPRIQWIKYDWSLNDQTRADGTGGR